MNKQRVTWIVLVLLAVTGLASVAQAQEENSNYTYEEYSYYTKAQKETDLAKKEAALFEFMEKFPQSTLVPNILGEFQNYFTGQMQQKNYDAVIAAAQKLLGIRPEEQVALQALAGAYFFKQDFTNYITYGEMIYAKHPLPEPAYYLGGAAVSIGDIPKAEKYLLELEKIGTLPMRIDVTFKIYNFYFTKKDEAKAVEYAQKVVALFENNPKPDDFQGDWGAFELQFLNPCYGYLGNYNMTRAKNYTVAAEMFTKILQKNPKDAATHFYLGMAYWLSGKATMAAPCLAKATVLKVSPISEKAAAQLNKLLTNAGLAEKYEEYLTKAKVELGLQ